VKVGQIDAKPLGGNVVKRAVLIAADPELSDELVDLD
jgi:hypothetical protein